MKILSKILSYAIAFMLGCITVLLMINSGQISPKLAQLELLIRNRFIGEYDETVMEDAAAAAMVAALGDRWSYYIPAANYAAYVEQSNNAYVGIGITITPDEESHAFRIVEVSKNGPAEGAGILPGDILIEAAGQSTEGLTTEELSNLIRGKEGTPVRIAVIRDGMRLDFTVIRANILTEVVTAELLDGKYGLVTIRNFDSRSAAESIAAISQLVSQGAEAMIFDVRNNHGGYAQELVAVLDYLLPEGVLFRSVDYRGHETIDRSDAACLELPIAVLCNERSYSAAEFFAAAIQEYGAGTVVGTPTVGKGYFQNSFELSDGSAVGLSVGKYFTPNGVNLQGVGIQPDVQVDVDDDTFAAILYSTLSPMEDPQILAALEVLKK